MSQLDVLVEQMKTEFDLGTKSKASIEHNFYHNKMYRAKQKGDMALLLKLAKEAKKFPAMNISDPSFKRLSYVRYADD
jgi:hypothetical protein